MTVFSGADAIRAFLDEFDGWLTKSVSVYLLGGSAMTIRGLKDQTEDIDLALGVVAEFEHVRDILQEQGFSITDEPTGSFDGVGATVQLHHPEQGLQIDLFERQIVGKYGSLSACAGERSRSGPGTCTCICTRRRGYVSTQGRLGGRCSERSAT